jgi:small subunit ribosomal protein S8
MITDQIADLLTQIRNAQRVGHPSVSVPASGTKQKILTVLQSEGYIDRYERIEEEKGKARLKIYLRYSVDGRPAIKEIKRLSKPGKRLYVVKEKIPVYKEGLGVVVVSTSRGMLSDRDARRLGVGGELICSVF